MAQMPGPSSQAEKEKCLETGVSEAEDNVK